MSTDAGALVICVEEGCERPVMQPGGPFGRGKRCEEHVKAAHAEGKRRQREGDPRPPRRPSRARTRTESKEESDKAPKVKRATSLERRIEAALTSIGTGVYLLNAPDGRAVLDGAHQLAVSLDQLAQQDPRVRNVLEKALAGGAWGAVIMSTGAIVVPILANHGLIGTVPLGQQPTPSPAPGTSWPTENGASGGPVSSESGFGPVT